MSKYRVEVSKNQKKFTIVIDADSSKHAREKVHNDWYSVLNIVEFNESSATGDKFYFSVEKNGIIKSGSIFGDDIFKVYLKLRKDLGYTIVTLYKNKDESEDTKKDLIKNLDDAFAIYTKNQEKKKDTTKSKVPVEKKEETIDDFYMKKELETTSKLIEFVLAKIESVLNSKNLGKIDPEKRKKIEQVYQNIIQIKSSTNVSKLKEVWELALLRIGQVELEVVEKEKNIYAKQFLKETNKLLKKIGSDKHFVEKDKDIKAQILLYIEKGKKALEDFQRRRKLDKKHQVDKTSYDYLKTLALLNRYKQRYREVQVELIKHCWHYLSPSKKEDFSKLLLTRTVLRQNIIIMKAKKSWKIYSYTKLVKWYEKMFKMLHKLFSFINRYLFVVVSIFSALFLLIIVVNYFTVSDTESIRFNYYWIYYVIFMIIFSLLTKLIRWFWTLTFSSVLFFSILIFASVNYK